MSRNYRLTPKPGIVRSGRVVNTSVKPVILSGKNIVKTKENNSKPVQRKIVKPVKKANKINDQRVRPPTPKPPRKAPKASKLRRRKELEIGKYKKAVQNLKNSGVGRILVMVACGPSIGEVDLPKLKGHPIIDIMSINKPDPRLHPTKYWVFCDQSQYTRNKILFENYQETLINTWSIKARHGNQILIRNKSGKGFSKDLLQGYYIGRSTTFANMQTAFWMNYDKVYIFGCDMCQPPGHDKLHFYGVNQDVDPSIRVQRFAKEAEHYLSGAAQLTQEERDKFVFCSSYNKWPFISKFGSMDHKVAIEHILEEANSKIATNEDK